MNGAGLQAPPDDDIFGNRRGAGTALVKTGHIDGFGRWRDLLRAHEASLRRRRRGPAFFALGLIELP